MKRKAPESSVARSSLRLMWTAKGCNAFLAPSHANDTEVPTWGNQVTTTSWSAAVSQQMMVKLWVSGLPERPSRGERRQATYPQRGSAEGAGHRRSPAMVRVARHL